MAQFLVLANDGTDPGALDRRMAVRPTHMARIEPFARDGTLMAGGAQLDAEGRMVGSWLLVELPDEASVHAWIEADPYRREGVWQRITVQPVRLAPLPYRPLPGAKA